MRIHFINKEVKEDIPDEYLPDIIEQLKESPDFIVVMRDDKAVLVFKATQLCYIS